MLTPEEIKSKLILSKTSQADIAKKIGISRSQLSTIINFTQKAGIELTKVIGENPFQMNDAEVKKFTKRKR